MPKNKQLTTKSPHKHPKYKKNVRQRSPFDNSPTLITNDYQPPTRYKDAVTLTLKLFRAGTPFNQAVDQAHSAFPHTNRNKLAEHTLKTIANDY